MSCEKRYLAFDLGAESGRAILGIIKDDSLTLKEIHRFQTGGIRINNHYYWNIVGFYAHIIEGLKKYVSEYGSKLDGIGVDTWGVDFGLLDKSGNLLGNPYTYRDSRTEGTAAIINASIGNDTLYKRTGIQLLPFNTVNQLVSMVKWQDQTLDIAENLLFIGDLLNYFLTGRVVSEFTAASISQLFNNTLEDWDSTIFEALGIPKRIAPHIIKAGDVIGKLNKDVANEVGLNEVSVIAPAVHDTASAAVAVPCVDDESAFLSSGTWSVVGVEIDKPIIDDKGMEMNISNSGGALNKTLYLKNVMGLWLIQCCKKVWNKTYPELTYQEIEKRASEAKPFVAFIDPDNGAFLNPVDMCEAIVHECRRTNQAIVDKNDIGTISRIIFESLALKYRYVLEKIEKATGKNVNVLHIIGGGSKNLLLNMFTANALGKQVTAGPIEATAIGNVLIQSVGDGLYDSLEQIRQVVRNSFEIDEFEPEEDWNTEYLKFEKIIESKV